ncbi:ATP-binding protein [Chryseobacterium sp. Leaf180]|uniref:Dph6-related ATP pyrophosphatase n=1 Tax=Chryseobacterium sp. Leaf180 TaxID=1736289 RepID=UPI0006F3649C|nr:diphthine--ammonia ligase [Chryseobacterium sp. Leaf180]KQR93889.1 ATP-binding protein [Chryseobacterium sp. Leaf180]
MKKPAIFNWSTGKDSALALYKILSEDRYEVKALLTSINKDVGRVSMHGVSVKLLEKQAENLNIPLIKLELPTDISMEDYNSYMEEKLSEIKKSGIKHSVFGDIFLEDLKIYRENQLSKLGISAVFPLWKRDTRDLIHEFLNLGFKTIITCVNEMYLDKSFAGRIIDENFLKDLPEDFDPCGENGEFHTFTFDGPIFSEPIKFEIGEVVKKTYPKPKTGVNEEEGDYVFWFCDLY